MSYDITSDGQIIYLNGRGVFLLGEDRKSTLILKSDVIADVIIHKLVARSREELQDRAEAI